MASVLRKIAARLGAMTKAGPGSPDRGVTSVSSSPPWSPGEGPLGEAQAYLKQTTAALSEGVEALEALRGAIPGLFLPGEDNPNPACGLTIEADLATNLNRIWTALGGATDLVIREFEIGFRPPVKAAVVFIDGLVKEQVVRNAIIKPLVQANRPRPRAVSEIPDLFREITGRTITASEVVDRAGLARAIDSMLAGDTVLLVDGLEVAIVATTKGWEKRPIEESKIEPVVRGPREALSETIRISTALIRRRLKDPNLRLEGFEIGVRSKTSVVMGYIQDLANPKVVEEVRRRLRRINIDAILESGYIEELITDNPATPFATVGKTERPDVVAGKLVEGRVAIFVDGTPFVLTVPHLFVEELGSPEDHYTTPLHALLVRLIRLAAFSLAVFLPGLFVAVTTVNPEWYPTPFLFTLTTTHEGTPLPAPVEAVAMGIVFEILREAGVRLPRPFGQAVSIVGALIIGEAGVAAGLFTSTMVIVTAATGISTFALPTFDAAFAATLLRLPFTILGAILGLYGILIGVVALVIHLASLRSFGIPYLSPLAPLTPADWKDLFIRAPRWEMRDRPRLIGVHHPRRQEEGMKPHPPGQ